MILIDERSMLTADVMGAAERNSSVAAHGGSHDNEDWGGIPVVILVGDDYQLPPPTNKEKGAFDIMDSKSSMSQQKFGVASSGALILDTMADKCMELTSVKRQNNDQLVFKNVLERLRVGEATDQDAKFLQGLHMSNFSEADAHDILTSGVVMHLFATKSPRDEFNLKKLGEVSSSDNPVALLKAQWSSSHKIASHTIQNHYKSPPAIATLVTRGAIVRIVDQNFEPTWGLYNNAIGRVVEIVFELGKDPNKGDLPLYVVVQFEHYCGDVWYPENPKVSHQPWESRITMSLVKLHLLLPSKGPNPSCPHFTCDAVGTNSHGGDKVRQAVLLCQVLPFAAVIRHDPSYLPRSVSWTRRQRPAQKCSRQSHS